MFRVTGNGGLGKCWTYIITAVFSCMGKGRVWKLHFASCPHIQVVSSGVTEGSVGVTVTLEGPGMGVHLLLVEQVNLIKLILQHMLAVLTAPCGVINTNTSA